MPQASLLLEFAQAREEKTTGNANKRMGEKVQCPCKEHTQEYGRKEKQEKYEKRSGEERYK